MNFNPVVWFEIYVDDMARAQRFYEQVLQVRLQSLPMPGDSQGDMQMLAFPAEMQNSGAAGVLVKMDGMKAGAGGTLVYFGSADCSVEAGRAAAAGGAVVQEKFSLGEYGFAALIKDSEGNVIGLHSMA